MALSALEQLDLQDQLDDLKGKQAGATGLDLMDLLDQIDEVMAKLGYQAAKPDEVPPPEPEPPQPNPDTDVPENVRSFLAGEWDTLDPDLFVMRIGGLDNFIGKFLTMDDVIAGAERWWDTTGAAAAAVYAEA